MHTLSPIQAPLVYDDLIELHDLLETGDLFLQLLTADVKGRVAA